jgi:hypothetical protein
MKHFPVCTVQAGGECTTDWTDPNATCLEPGHIGNSYDSFVAEAVAAAAKKHGLGRFGHPQSREAGGSGRQLRPSLDYLDEATTISKFRGDMHPGGTPGKLCDQNSGTEACKPKDCMHWCLPGLPDHWNQAIFNTLLSAQHTNGRNKGDLDNGGCPKGVILREPRIVAGSTTDRCKAALAQPLRRQHHKKKEPEETW